MQTLSSLQHKKSLIDDFLQQYLAQTTAQFSQQSLTQAAFAQLTQLAVSGKSLRGGLFLLATEALDSDHYQQQQADFVKVAAALELIQTGLLIHDDIIDRDSKRRGQNSTWQHYAQNAPHPQLSRSEQAHFGYSMAICVGSVAQYLAMALLEELTSVPQAVAAQLRQQVSREISKTYFAEMLDEQLTVQAELPSIDEVLEMYTYKTARYTMVLPLQLAARTTEASAATHNQLEKIGETLGLIFQIKDDEIGIFAQQDQSGKSTASDLLRGKKTLFSLELLQQLPADSQELRTLQQLFGRTDLRANELDTLQQLFATHATPAVKQRLDTLLEQAHNLIHDASVPDSVQKLLEELLIFSFERTK